MNLLLDTHILLWWLADDPHLPAPVRSVIALSDNAIMVSAASAWEISMKLGAGRLEALTLASVDRRFPLYDVTLLPLI